MNNSPKRTNYDLGAGATAETRSSYGLLKRLAIFDEALSEQKLAARFVFGNNTLIVGCKNKDPGYAVGLVFRSETALVNAIKRYRLIDLAKAYISGEMRIDGDINDAVRVLDAVGRRFDKKQTSFEKLSYKFFRRLGHFLPNFAWKFEAFDHYQQSSKAYELFLDEWMQYTCGRFVTGAETLTEAQEAKFHFIGQLAASQIGPLYNAAHLDVGCGWGGLLSYFSHTFGTKSLGITNTPNQAEYSRKKYNADIVVSDFRGLSGIDRKFDLITIVGMMEHLSPQRRDELLITLRNILTDNGVIYLQCIGKPDDWIGGDAFRVAQEIVFPGHFVEFDFELRNRLTDAGFEILQSFEHGSDYAKTIKFWVEAISENRVAIEELIGAKQTRVFIGYLAYAAFLFGEGRGSLCRYLVQKQRPQPPESNDL